MAQHFLLSAGARSLSAAKIMHMSDNGVENVFLRLQGMGVQRIEHVQGGSFEAIKAASTP